MVPAEQAPGGNLTAMSVKDAARFATKLNAGAFEVSEDMISADIAAGVPVNSDGTLNIINYAAWLASKGLKRGR